MSRKGPSRTATRPQAHVRVHDQVTSNERWYGDEPPDRGKGFTAAETHARSSTVQEILLRAAKRAETNDNSNLAKAFYQLVDKLAWCKARRRCGSLACPQCARAFQKAKSAAQAAERPDRHLVFVTLIPKGRMYAPGQFYTMDFKKANRWLKDTLKPLGKRTMFGSVDLSWESRRGGTYVQLHWHLGMWTRDPDKLRERLRAIFPRTKKYERPVDVKPAEDLKFLPYLNKGIKWNDLLRRGRTHLPELLLVLDQINPVDMMILTRFRLSAQEGNLELRPIERSKRKT